VLVASTRVHALKALLGGPEDMLLAGLGLSDGNAYMNNFKNEYFHEIFIFENFLFLFVDFLI
jgi:hypothetical protein